MEYKILTSHLLIKTTEENYYLPLDQLKDSQVWIIPSNYLWHQSLTLKILPLYGSPTIIALNPSVTRDDVEKMLEAVSSYLQNNHQQSYFDRKFNYLFSQLERLIQNSQV